MPIGQKEGFYNVITNFLKIKLTKRNKIMFKKKQLNICLATPPIILIDRNR